MDLIVASSDLIRSKAWLGSEIAGHIARYGVWVKGEPVWQQSVSVGSVAIDRKRRRVLSYLKALEEKWFVLDAVFREKYSYKLRREIQRLLLLERQIPIPPTKILDSFWETTPFSPSDIRVRFAEFIGTIETPFVRDLAARMADFFVRNSRDSGILKLSQNVSLASHCKMRDC